MYQWLISATNYVNGYIAGIVDFVPVSPAPPMLIDLEEDLAHVMYLRRNLHETGKETGIDKMWKEAIDRLENIRNGTFLLLSGSGTILSNTQRNAEPYSSVEGYTPTFGMSDIENAEVDPDRQDAEENAR